MRICTEVCATFSQASIVVEGIGLTVSPQATPFVS
jgi:hypothetical protein